MTIRECVRYGQERLASAGIENAANEARYLLEDILAVDRSFLFVHDTRMVSEQDVVRYKAWIARRCTHEPMQYITGRQEFMGLSFYVNAHVLIPRQDTEVLVEEAMKRLTPDMHILDLCCGSGCIGISLMRFAHVDAVLADISQEALAVAAANATALLAAETAGPEQASVKKPQIIQTDLFSAIHDTFDMIVSNPPYIKSAVIGTLMEEVRDHEPLLALDGREDGLYFYREIIRQAGGYLRDGGYLLFEIGYDQGDDLRKILVDAGYTQIQVVKDLAGLDRVVIARYRV